MIRDKLIEHINNMKVGEALLLENDALFKALTIALNIESAAECADTLTNKDLLSVKQPPQILLPTPA